MKIENVFERALALLAGQFQDRPAVGQLTNLQKFIKVFCDQAQEIQDEIQKLKDRLSIDLAEGVQLDRIGDILGLKRGSRTDAEYREALRFQAFVNQSKGTPEDILTFLRYVTKSSDVHIQDSFPAGFIAMTTGYVDPTYYPSLNKAISQVSPAGVKLVALLRENDDLRLRMAEYSDSGITFAPNSGGFAEAGTPIDLANAGSLAEVLINNIP